MRKRLVASLGGVVLMLAPASGQEPALDAVLARAGAYVVEFQRQLSGVVAEEQYVQDVRYPLGAGTRYSNGNVELRGKGMDWTLTELGATTTLESCKQYTAPKP